MRNHSKLYHQSVHTFYLPGMLIKDGTKEIQMFLYIHNCLSDVPFMHIISGLLLTTQVLFKNYCLLINERICKTARYPVLLVQYIWGGLVV